MKNNSQHNQETNQNSKTKQKTNFFSIFCPSKNKSTKIISFFEKIFIALVAFLYSASNAYAQTTEWKGVCVGGNNNDVATIQGLECLIANIFTVTITLIGLSAFVMFIIGSVRWLMSGGNSSSVDKARGTLTYAVIGIVVALSAFIVLNLLAGFTGIETIKTFRIPTSQTDLLAE